MSGEDEVLRQDLLEDTIENEYLADIEKDNTKDASCSKAYNTKFDIIGGIMHLKQQGFTALHKGESALQVLLIFHFQLCDFLFKLPCISFQV